MVQVYGETTVSRAVTNTVHRQDRSVTSLTASVSPVSLVTGEELVIRTAVRTVQDRDVVDTMESVLTVWLVDGDLTVIRSVTNTVHRQDRSVTSLLVPVYLGVYQDGGVIHVQNPVTNTVQERDVVGQMESVSIVWLEDGDLAVIRSVTNIVIRPVTYPMVTVYLDVTLVTGMFCIVIKLATNTVDRQDRSVTSLLVPVYLGV